MREELEDLFLTRNEEALARVRAEFGGLMFSAAYGITGDRAEAEECVSDALLDAWNSIPPMPKSMPAYITKLVRSRAIDRVRERKSQRRGGGELPLILDELSECVPDPASSHFEDELALRTVIAEFTAALPSEERRLFLGRYFFSRTVKELAAEFGLTRGAVKMRLMRTRQKLKQILEKEGIEV